MNRREFFKHAAPAVAFVAVAPMIVRVSSLDYVPRQIRFLPPPIPLGLVEMMEEAQREVNRLCAIDLATYGVCMSSTDRNGVRSRVSPHQFLVDVRE